MAEWVALGDRAIRFARPSVSARALVREIRTWPGVVDVVVAGHDVAAYFDREPVIDRVRLAALANLRDDAEPVRDVAIRVVYDGPDLDDVARATQLSAAEVQRAHAAATYVVDTIGFAPGFAYLTGLPAQLHVPRRATPRARVPGGSLAIADAYTAIYPFDSPGGWHLIGRITDAPMFDERGARLQLGDRVRFVS
ncbi:MAG TPA: carboxyltransferase domain-containing protein [Kofleriaceae bacterium]